MSDIKVNIHNKWDIVVRDAKTGEIKRKVSGKNIVLNQWWDKYLSSNAKNCLRYIHFGSGTDTPVATNAKLKIPEGSKDSGSTWFEHFDMSAWKSTGVIKVQKTIRLGANEYVGKDIVELGFATALNTSGDLVTHAVISDSNGNPISVTKHDDEVIDIFGTVFFDIGWDMGRTQWINLPKVPAPTYTYIYLLPYVLCCLDADMSLAIPHSSNAAVFYGAITGKMGGMQRSGRGLFLSALPATPNVSYNVPNKTLTFSLADFAVENGNNFYGISCLILGGLFIRLPITGFTQPVITKEIVGAGDGSNKDFATKFGFVKNNSTAKIYVNDVEVSASIDYDKPVPRISGYYLDPYMNTLSGNTETGDSVVQAGLESVYENPFYATWGIKTVRYNRGKAYVSDDLENWTNLVDSGYFGTLTVPAEHRNKRYWKWVNGSDTQSNLTEFYSEDFENSQNIHLAVEPSAGATVAVTYQPDMIAKDDQHTLKDMSVTFSFNEYTPT